MSIDGAVAVAEAVLSSTGCQCCRLTKPMLSVMSVFRETDRNR